MPPSDAAAHDWNVEEALDELKIENDTLKEQLEEVNERMEQLQRGSRW